MGVQRRTGDTWSLTRAGLWSSRAQTPGPQPGWVTPRCSPARCSALPPGLPPGRDRENEQRPGNEAVGGRGPGRMSRSLRSVKALLIYFIFNLNRLMTLWKQRLFYVKPQNP